MVITKLDVEVARLRDKVDEMEEILKGDGSEDNPGLDKKFSIFMGIWSKREEDKKKFDDRMQAIAIALLGGVIGLIVAYFTEKIHGHAMFHATKSAVEAAFNSGVRW